MLKDLLLECKLLVSSVAVLRAGCCFNSRGRLSRLEAASLWLRLIPVVEGQVVRFWSEEAALAKWNLFSFFFFLFLASKLMLYFYYLRVRRLPSTVRQRGVLYNACSVRGYRYPMDPLQELHP